MHVQKYIRFNNIFDKGKLFFLNNNISEINS